jgi:SAM-dependent methyltransferase
MTTRAMRATPSEVSAVRGTSPSGGDDWDQHWNDYSTAAEANPAQRYRRRLALQLLGQTGQPRRLLDFGSGQGDLLRDAATRWPGTELLGIEPSDVGVAASREKVPRARFLACDLMSDPGGLPDDLRGWASHAVCSEVLEHVDEPVGLLSTARAAMAPGCLIVVTVPGGRMSTFDKMIGHRRHYSPESLAGTLREAGFDVDWASGAGFPFFNFYRALVIARGDRLAADVASSGGGKPSAAARAAMFAFRPLLRMSLTRSPWGVQIVGVARARS